MAIAVIVGLSFATVLTLVLVPVMYSLVDDFGKFFARHYKRREVEAAPRPETRPAQSAAREEAEERVPVMARERLRTVEG